MYFNFITVYIEPGHFKFRYIQTIRIITGSIKTSLLYKKTTFILNIKFKTI
jgi:hypothetical protein